MTMGLLRTRVNDPYNTMGAAPAGKQQQRPVPAGAAQRDTSRRLSSWLKSKRLDSPGTPACGTCKGTGTSGWKDDQGRTIVCPDCGGLGY